ncbi:hypothetical protein CpipJ_CPIJ001141, partial [Culex quinquefasciatus]
KNNVEENERVKIERGGEVRSRQKEEKRVYDRAKEEETNKVKKTKGIYSQR